VRSYDLLLSDSLRIRLIQPPGLGAPAITVGHYGVTRIEVTTEPGQCGRVPWFAVYGADDDLLCMVNAAHVQQVDFYPPEHSGEVR
jgi:hypothetical protein